MIFLHTFSTTIEQCSEIQTNLLLKKVCMQEFHQNETVCDNLDLEENDSIETDGTIVFLILSPHSIPTNFTLYVRLAQFLYATGCPSDTDPFI